MLASRAARERPESLIARSLFERTRREMTRGKRRERLEARVTEARGLIDGGDFAGAEKIVATVLKLLPDHAAALELFGVLKERRLAGGSAEAEAERELAAMMHARARRAAEQARAAIAAGWSFRALMTVRRRWPWSPTTPTCSPSTRESLRQVDKTAGQRAIRRAAHARVLSAQGRMSAGEAAEAARILRAVLKEDPANPEARDALATMEQVAPPRPRGCRPAGVITGRFSIARRTAPRPLRPPPAAARARPARASAPRPRRRVPRRRRRGDRARARTGPSPGRRGDPHRRRRLRRDDARGAGAGQTPPAAAAAPAPLLLAAAPPERRAAAPACPAPIPRSRGR